MSPWINYHHLFYFKTIAEEGSVSKAALKLRLGQPTLSAQLMQFEDNLGVTLFERQHKKLILTEQGQVALDYAKNIFKMGSEMFEVLHDRLQPLMPSLHIGAIDSIPKQIVLKIAKQAQKISPCQLTLSEGRPNELIRELQAHKMDLLISNYVPAGANGKGLYPRLITKNQVSFYASPHYKNLKKGFPDSISRQPMILPTYDSQLRQDLDHWAKLHNIQIQLTVETQDIALKKLMAIHHMGLVAAASHTVTGQLNRGELIEIGTMSGVYEEIFLISAQRKIENPIAAKLKSSFVV